MSALTKKQKGLISDVSLLFVAAVWGGGFVAVKDTLNAMTPMMLMAVRFSLAAVIVYLALFKWIGRISREELKKGAVVGFFLFSAFAVQTYGLQYTTASKQGFLTAIYVVFVPLLSWIFYKKRPGIRAFLGSGLTILGIALISLQGGFNLNLGDTLTLMCAVLYAAHILSIEYFAKDMNVFKLAFLQIAIAAVFFIIIALLTEPIPTVISTRSWISIGYMAMFATFGCFTVQTVAQKYTTSSHASILLSLESVFAALFGILLLGEVMTPMVIVGCALIFVAIMVIEVEWPKKG